jgi:hypothetical protein
MALCGECPHEKVFVNEEFVMKSLTSKAIFWLKVSSGKSLIGHATCTVLRPLKTIVLVLNKKKDSQNPVIVY